MKKTLLFFCFALLTSLAIAQPITGRFGAPNTAIGIYNLVTDSTLKIPGGAKLRYNAGNVQYNTGEGWTNIGGGASYLFNNGISNSGGNVGLGGALTSDATINASQKFFSVSNALNVFMGAKNSGNTNYNNISLSTANSIWENHFEGFSDKRITLNGNNIDVNVGSGNDLKFSNLARAQKPWTIYFDSSTNKVSFAPAPSGLDGPVNADNVQDGSTNIMINTGTQTIPGVKTFSDNIYWGNHNSQFGTTTQGSYNYGNIRIGNTQNSYGINITSVTPTATRQLKAPDKNGTLATLEDVTDSISKAIPTFYLSNGVSTGTRIMLPVNDSTAKFRRVKAGTNTTIDSTDEDFTINSTAGGFTLSNATGTGLALGTGITSTTGTIKRLKQGTNVTLTTTADDITINAASASMDTTTTQRLHFTDSTKGPVLTAPDRSEWVVKVTSDGTLYTQLFKAAPGPGGLTAVNYTAGSLAETSSGSGIWGPESSFGVANRFFNLGMVGSYQATTMSSASDAYKSGIVAFASTTSPLTNVADADFFIYVDGGTNNYTAATSGYSELSVSSVTAQGNEDYRMNVLIDGTVQAQYYRGGVWTTFYTFTAHATGTYYLHATTGAYTGARVNTPKSDF